MQVLFNHARTKILKPTFPGYRNSTASTTAPPVGGCLQACPLGAALGPEVPYRVMGIESKIIARDIVAKGLPNQAIQYLKARHPWGIDLAAMVPCIPIPTTAPWRTTCPRIFRVACLRYPPPSPTPMHGTTPNLIPRGPRSRHGHTN